MIHTKDTVIEGKKTQKSAEIKEPNWTAKMLQSFEQSERGEIYAVDMDNFWNV
jgi:hypothetical protein